MLDSKLLFFFGALGAFNAFVIGFYFSLLKKSRSALDYMLSLILFLLAIRVGVSCVYFFGEVNTQLVQAGQVANLLLGPTLFYLFKLQMKADINKYDYVHLFVLASAISLLWVLFDFRAWDWPVRFSLHAVLTVYFVVIAIKWRKELLSFIQGRSQKQSEKQVALVYLATAMVCLGFGISLVVSYIMGPIIFSIILYVTIGLFLKLNRPQKASYQQKKIDHNQFEELSSRLKLLMEDKKLYRDPNLKLDTLASNLSVSKHLLSQLLNDNLKRSFNQFVNEYRIESACELLEGNKHYSMEAIGYEVGFHSRSSFFSTFKKIKGTTPAQFKSTP